ncbi:MAG: hypothetical protein ACKVWR_21070 [Acidimicrobiales bacterium]
MTPQDERADHTAPGRDGGEELPDGYGHQRAPGYGEAEPAGPFADDEPRTPWREEEAWRRQLEIVGEGETAAEAALNSTAAAEGALDNTAAEGALDDTAARAPRAERG